MSSFKDQLNKINKYISEINKRTSDLSILAATKSVDINKINEAIDARIRIFGENYVKEAEDKWKEIKNNQNSEENNNECNYNKNKIELHCIGHLQQNKIKKAVEIFDVIQTVDSIKTAEEINKRCKAIKKIMPILIEINIADEKNKSGCKKEDALELAEFITKKENIKLNGIMIMGPNVESPEKLRPYFKDAKNIFDKLNEQFPKEKINTLSMGMSESYKVAIEEGATMIRIGSALFGKRMCKNN